ncbi:hypothetical protein K490DRAFT_62929 [Saccharata proteae CBS 121410]|uniref:Uncharacterized protein n=1 Tax=Saccharata proteae CBS 121410 TaxID=1314787 RepID=A0A9P4LWY9_9PEZI|nr:hypothetical protein K490DRAFT_62929 [Saccharata proteae CBS 121410]
MKEFVMVKPERIIVLLALTNHGSEDVQIGSYDNYKTIVLPVHKRTPPSSSNQDHEKLPSCQSSTSIFRDEGRKSRWKHHGPKAIDQHQPSATAKYQNDANKTEGHSFMLKLFPNPRIYCSALFIDVAFFPNKNSEKCVVQPIVATGDFRIFQRVAFKGTDRCLALYECTWPETEAADAPTQTPNGSHQYAWLRPRHLWSAQGWNAYQRRTHMQVQDMQRLSKAMMGLVEEDCGPRWWSKRWSKAWDEEAEGGPRVSTRAPDGFPNTKQLERLDEALENAFTRMENTRREKKIKAVMQNERVSGLSFKPPALGVNGGHP